jgi:MAF protein
VAKCAAALKAAAVSRLRPEAVVLGADTVVVLDGRVLGKPSGLAEAAQMLRDLRGRDHQVITGVAVARQGNVTSAWEVTTVRLRALSDLEIAEYVGTGSPLDKAGAYGIQDSPISPAARYDGCYLNVVGLPLCVLSRLLVQARVLAGPEAALPCPGHSAPTGARPGGRPLSAGVPLKEAPR